MTTLAHDTRSTVSSRFTAGLAFALLSAVSFGFSGALARGLLDVGWTAGAAVTARIGLAAAVLLVPGVLALRGRWSILREEAGLMLVYGVLGVAGCQLCYFYAVEHLQVGVALLIEYTAPVAVVAWMWLRHGQRPGPLTLVGAVVAAVGLALVLDVVSGAGLSLVGVAWALGAMVGVTAYFVISADNHTRLPAMTLAAGGLVVASTVLAAAGVVGVLPMAVSSAPVDYAGFEMAWWVPVLGLGLVTAALAYVTGIAAGRRLGSRMASFIGLTEVVAAVVFAWVLLDELPGWIQLAGGFLILAGIVVVKRGEVHVSESSATVAAGRSATDGDGGRAGRSATGGAAGRAGRSATDVETW